MEAIQAKWMSPSMAMNTSNSKRAKAFLCEDLELITN
jgi:hypothetical protein